MSENNFLPYEIKVKIYNKKNRIISLIICLLVFLNLLQIGTLYINRPSKSYDKYVVNNENVISKRINGNNENIMEEFFCILDNSNWDNVIVKDNTITFSLQGDSKSVEKLVSKLERNKKFKLQMLSRSADKNGYYDLSVRME